MPSVLSSSIAKISTSKHPMYSSVDHWYLRPCTSAYDQEDCPWRMMVKVVPYRRWGIIRFVGYCKFLIGRALSVLINVKRTPSKLLSLVVFISILLQHPRTIKSSRSDDRCNSVIDLLPSPLLKIVMWSLDWLLWVAWRGHGRATSNSRSLSTGTASAVSHLENHSFLFSGKFNKTKSIYTLNLVSHMRFEKD